MHRIAAGLLCLLIAVTALGTPAPRPKPWVSGWDKPVNPQGDCRFDRQEDKLTIIVPSPGKGPASSNYEHASANAPYLLREVRGDFVAQVRVEGGFRMNGRRGFHRAGLILTDGTNIVRLERFATAPGVGEEEMATFRGSIMITVPPSASGWFDTSYLDGPPLEKPANLRLERRGSSLMFAWGQDGKEWTRHPEPYPCKLPHRLKIGVVAESTAAEVLKAEFSDFKLSLLKK